VICRASHSAVGCRVTSNHTSCRRSWPRTKNANKRSKVTVRTTHISMAAIASALLRRNIFQLCDGGLPPRTKYFETVDWATSKPSISNSPWIRDAPHSGFSLLIRRIRSRSPRSILGRPALPRDFQRQNILNPARCHRRIVSGCTIWTAPSSLGQSLVIHMSRTRSLARRRGPRYALRRAMLS